MVIAIVLKKKIQFDGTHATNNRGILLVSFEINKLAVSYFLIYLEEKWGLKSLISVKKHFYLSLISISRSYIH